ncbi:hypothetical protein [Thioalkalivibrio denitrificans]|nr:hypothetical protein [Thioalkalivibrio denitrificans]
MGFEYGSQAIEVRNPFKAEGAAYAVRGLIVAPLGIYLLLYAGVEEGVAEPDARVALQLAVGVLLLAVGLYALGLGLFKMFRFYTGRGVPANLASTVAASATIAPGSEESFRHPGIYNPAKLSEMLSGRKNLTFEEPRGWLARLLNGLCFSMIFLPHPMRWITLKLFMALWHAMVVLAILGLMFLSARALGMVEITGTAVFDYLGAAALVAILLIWVVYQPTPLWRNTDLRNPRTSSSRTPFQQRSFGQFLGLAVRLALLWVALPLGILMILLEEQRTTGLPELPVSPWPWLAALVAAVVLAFVYSFLMAWRRAPRRSVPTDVSEYRDHWQETVHPKDIFRAIEMTLANHRYLDIPNRVYHLSEPDLHEQSGNNQGTFEGETLQEIQPEPLARQRRDPLALPGAVLGQLLLLGAALWLFQLVHEPGPLSAQAAMFFLGPLLLWLLGRSVAYVANMYLGEIRFQSQLIAFRASGTYSQVRLGTGSSILDSNRSESHALRSSITPWLVVSRIGSSIIAVSGAMNLEQPRYVLDMEPSDDLTKELVDDVRRYLRERQVLAPIESSADAQSVMDIHRMNERTRAVHSTALPPVSEEILRERLGPGTAEEN